MGKRMEDHLRFAIAYWHSFAWEGQDPFGGPTFVRPWHPQDDMGRAKMKADVAFEMFDLLNVPFFCWHDLDLRPDQGNFADNASTLDEITDYVGSKMEGSKTGLLWGTANMFSNPAGKRQCPICQLDYYLCSARLLRAEGTTMLY